MRGYGKRTPVLAGTLCLFVLTCLSCEEGDPLPGGFDLEADFVPDPGPAGVEGGYVSLQPGSSVESGVVIDVVVTDIDVPVTGIALKLTYPASFSVLVGCLDGDLFPAGVPCFSSSQGSGVGFIARGVALGQATLVPGAHVIASVEFLVFDEGAGEIVIEGQNLGGSNASALLDSNGDPIVLDWFSGTLVGF